MRLYKVHEALIVSGYVLEFGGQAAEIGRRQSAPVYPRIIKTC